MVLNKLWLFLIVFISLTVAAQDLNSDQNHTYWDTNYFQQDSNNAAAIVDSVNSGDAFDWIVGLMEGVTKFGFGIFKGLLGWVSKAISSLFGFDSFWVSLLMFGVVVMVFVFFLTAVFSSWGEKIKAVLYILGAVLVAVAVIVLILQSQHIL